MKDLQKSYPEIFIEEVGLGLMRGLRMRDVESLEKFIKKAKENRVLILKSGKNTARFLPPLTITLEEMEEGFKRLEEVIGDLG